MELLSLFDDPRLLGIVVCVGVIGLLRWINVTQ